MKKVISLLFVLLMMFSTVAYGAETAYSDIEGTVYWIGKMYEGDGWITMNMAAALAGEELGIDVITQTPTGGESDIAGQIALVESALDAGAAAIVLGANDADAMIDVCKKVQDAGIPMVLVDSGINSEDYDVLVAFDNYQVGVQLAEAVAASIDGKGQVGIISAIAGPQTIAQREQGFLDTLAANYPDIELAGEILYCNNDSTKAMNQTYDLLTAYPDVKAIFTTNSIAVEGVAAAIVDLGTEVGVFGSDGSDAIVQYIKDGVILGETTASSVNMGYLSIVCAAKLIKGESIDTIEWNGRTFTLAGKDFDTGIYVCTPENIEDDDIDAALHPYAFFETYAGTAW